MATQIQAEQFTQVLRGLLDETFDQVHGYYLDEGTSFFETLSTISAAEASIPVGGTCATLAAQVKHTAFYLDVLAAAVRTQQFMKTDWAKIWRETGAVSAAEWQAIQADLRTSYDHVKILLDEIDDFSSVERIGGLIAIVVHTAYHLGEIRQALCVIKST